MKRGITALNALVFVIIIVGSLFVVSLIGGVSKEDVSGAYTQSGNLYNSVKTGDIIRIGGDNKTVSITKVGKTGVTLSVNGMDEIIVLGNKEFINGVSIKVLKLYSRSGKDYANLEIKVLPTVNVYPVLDTSPFIETISVFSTCVGNKVISVEEIGATGSIVVDVSKIKGIIAFQDTKNVNGIEITNSEISGTKVVLALKIPTGC